MVSHTRCPLFPCHPNILSQTLAPYPPEPYRTPMPVFRQTVQLISHAPGRHIRAALPGLILLCASHWMLQRNSWALFEGASPQHSILSVMTPLAGIIAGLVLLGLFVQRSLLQEPDAAPFGGRDLAATAARYASLILVGILATIVVLYLVESIISPGDLVFRVGLGLMTPQERLNSASLAGIFLIATALLWWTMLLPLIWLGLRTGLALPATALQQKVGVRESWRRTRPLRRSLWSIALYVVLIFGTTSAGLQLLMMQDIMASLLAVDVSKPDSVLNVALNSPPQAFPDLLSAAKSLHMVLLALTLLCVSAAVYRLAETRALKPSHP